jgi:hypothetical protein
LKSSFDASPPKETLVGSVEHVHIHEGGQVVIGNVRARCGNRGVSSSA